MTTIVLLLWLADVCGNVGLICGACLIAFIGIYAVGAIRSGCIFVADDRTPEPGYALGSWKYARWLLIPVLLGTVVPNASTVKLAAAGVAFSETAKTEVAQKALGAFNAMLDRITAEAKKP